MNSANRYIAHLSTHLGVRIMLLETLLFIALFCFYCCLIPTNSKTATDSFDPFISSIKEAFSEEFDPIIENPETIEETTNSRRILCLPAGKNRQHNQVTPINNAVLIVPFTAEKLDNSSVNPESLSYKELKEFIKVHNLQTTVKNICRKPYNRCKRQELIHALTA